MAAERVLIKHKPLPFGMLKRRVYHPDELVSGAFMEGFPAAYRCYRYEVRDRRSLQFSDASPLGMFGSVNFGACALSFVSDQVGMQIDIDAPGVPAYGIIRLERGTMGRLAPGESSPSVGTADTGLIARGLPGARMLTSGETARLNIWISASSLESRLEVLLEGALHRPLLFEPTFPWDSEAGRSIDALMGYVRGELSRPDSLLSRQVGAGAIEDMLADMLLQGLRHNHSDLLQHRRSPLLPSHLRRAEDYLRSHLELPLRLADLAAASGCSIRSLQEGFSSHFGATPTAMLLRLRLEQARADLGRQDQPSSVQAIATRYGFSNPGRFARQYRAAFGELPSGRKPPEEKRSR